MYIIYIFAILAFIISIGIMIKWKEFDFSDPDTYYGCFGSTILSALIGFIVTFLWSASTYDNPENLIHKTESYEILSLQDNSNVEGDFFLGCGNVNGYMMYTFYYKDEKDDIRGKELSYDNVVLQYSSETPKYEISYEITKDSPFRIIFNGTIVSKTYKIYIPEGSIINNYNLDTK